MRFPYPVFAGTDQVSFNLIKALSENNEVTLISHVRSKENIADVPILKNYCKEVITVQFPNPKTFLGRLWKRFKREFLLFFCLIPREFSDYTSKELGKVIKKKLKEEKYDFVQIEYFYAGKYQKYIKDAISVILSNDAYFITAYQIFKFKKRLKSKIVSFFEYLAIKRYELKMYKKFNWVFFISKKDEEIIKELIPGLTKTRVIPLGFEIKDNFKGEEEIKKSLIFVGGMRAYFNIDAMLFFCKDIFPLIEKEVPDVKLYIVGESPGEAIKSLSLKNNIFVTGSVPDVKPFINKCEIFIAPLRIGTGIKTKIIEALACGKPIVTTSICVQGLEVENGKHIIIADEPESFAKKVIELLKNSNMRKELSRNAQKLFYERYELNSVKNKIQKIYSDILMHERAGA
ncbi:MAG: hypothetical protein A2042_06040 [Candidatus Schekmanbacteria bacterium GWA2_38_11]|uniref:Glycosyltransferase subfamily 4-like N-terminal domain-containing protein n=1 Tax=Candidatus Schekmanbacteria bacterium GWA2_38_11 TaxID=1817876 RepID=A0A1F7RAS9_9BACT|nr:MAG: hypothetical protein A2042_06040 [Candidatus Schekmanbacteria bacterium GWA2_38_11]